MVVIYAARYHVQCAANYIIDWLESTFVLWGCPSNRSDHAEYEGVPPVFVLCSSLWRHFFIRLAFSCMITSSPNSLQLAKRDDVIVIWPTRTRDRLVTSSPTTLPLREGDPPSSRSALGSTPFPSIPLWHPKMSGQVLTCQGGAMLPWHCTAVTCSVGTVSSRAIRGATFKVLAYTGVKLRHPKSGFRVDHWCLSGDT